MPLDQDRAAENIRRMAGMHGVTLEQLADFLGMSRPGLMRLVARDPAKRSHPSPDTAFKIADAFNIDLQSLYSDVEACLWDAIKNYPRAPIRRATGAPMEAEAVTVPNARNASIHAGSGGQS